MKIVDNYCNTVDDDYYEDVKDDDYEDNCCNWGAIKLGLLIVLFQVQLPSMVLFTTAM